MAVNSNAGCGVSLTEPGNYGPAFNDNGGGWYAIERAADHISIWFWARNDRRVPLQIKRGEGFVNPKEWVRALALKKPIIDFVSGHAVGLLPKYQL